MTFLKSRLVALYRLLRPLWMRVLGGPWAITSTMVVLIVSATLVVSGFSRMIQAAEPTLLDAAERGDRAAVTRMLARGADPNAPGPDGTTAIMYAASNGDVELVRALLKAGANVKLKNQFGTSAITEAAIV